MTDTIYGVIVLAVSFAGAVIGTIVLFVGMGIRDALDRRPAPEYNDNRSVTTVQVAVQGDLHLHIGADAVPPAPRPAIGWHAHGGDVGAYMPARSRGERQPTALVSAARPALRGVDWLPLSVGSLLDALRSVPGASVTPPHDGYSSGVLVSTRDPAFIAAVRAAMPHTIGDVRLYSAYAPRRLLCETWCNGRAVEAGYVREAQMEHTPEHYWIVRPAGPCAGQLEDW
jgi:hypothetical protein